MAEAAKKYAVVTGANKGIGFAICRQLACEGITVVLTARDESRGLEALEKLRGPSGFPNRVIFHRLDVTDSASIDALAKFIESQFGKLDILVNNAAIIGSTINLEVLESAKAEAEAASGTRKELKLDWNQIMNDTYDLAVEAIQTNYYGAKRATEALLPLLHLSHSPRIVNVSSSMGKLENIGSEWAKGILNDAENLTEERIDQVIDMLLKDLKEGTAKAKGWPSPLAGYRVSKAAMNAYTRLLAKKNPTFWVNCVCPGFVKTDINHNTGFRTVEEGAEGPVKLALLPDDGPSGHFFVRKDMANEF